MVSIATSALLSGLPGLTPLDSDTLTRDLHCPRRPCSGAVAFAPRWLVSRIAPLWPVHCKDTFRDNYVAQNNTPLHRETLRCLVTPHFPDYRSAVDCFRRWHFLQGILSGHELLRRDGGGTGFLLVYSGSSNGCHRRSNGSWRLPSRAICLARYRYLSDL